jgi:hypothetical protein
MYQTNKAQGCEVGCMEDHEHLFINPEAISIAQAHEELLALDALSKHGYITEGQYDARKHKVLFDAGFVFGWKEMSAEEIAKLKAEMDR